MAPIALVYRGKTSNEFFCMHAFFFSSEELSQCCHLLRLAKSAMDLFTPDPHGIVELRKKYKGTNLNLKLYLWSCVSICTINLIENKMCIVFVTKMIFNVIFSDQYSYTYI